LALLLLILMVRRRQTQVAAHHSLAPFITPGLVSTAPVVEAARTAGASVASASDLRSLSAFHTLQNAFRAVAQARFYRMVSVARSGQSRFETTTVRLRVPGAAALIRTDILCYQGEDHMPVPQTTRTFISNAQGNWAMMDSAGCENVAFLVEDGQKPIDTVGMNDMITHTANEADPPAGWTYEESTGTFSGQAVIVVTENSAVRYFINRASGVLVGYAQIADGLSYLTTIDLNWPVDPDEFQIPSDRTVIPTSDLVHAQAYLSSRAGKN
jgi:hypothetical protein